VNTPPAFSVKFAQTAPGYPGIAIPALQEQLGLNWNHVKRNGRIACIDRLGLHIRTIESSANSTVPLTSPVVA